MYKELDFSIELTEQEKMVVDKMWQDDMVPHVFEYKENEYSKYCDDTKRIISRYVDEYKLPYDSINRIFEACFMYVLI